MGIGLSFFLVILIFLAPKKEGFNGQILLHGTLSENSPLEHTAFTSKAFGKSEIIEGKYMISEVTLTPTLTLPYEAQKEKAERVLQKSEAACLISNSIKSKIIFQPRIEAVEETTLA